MSNRSGSSKEIVRLPACPVCLETRLSADLPVPGRWIGLPAFAAHQHELGLTRCLGCDFVFVNPRPGADLLGSFYGGQTYVCHRSDRHDYMSPKADHLLDRIKQLQPDLGVLLDFGCGGGWLLRRAGERGLRAVGYDPGRAAVEACRTERLPVVSSMSEIPDGSCDGVVMHHVLEHVEDFGALFGEITRILRGPSSRVFIEVPNVRSLRARLSTAWLSRRCGFDERYRAFPIHLSYFSPATLPRLLERSGFRICSVETYGLGVDELFWDDASEREAYATHGTVNGARKPSARRFGALRDLVKSAVYGAALGENLFVSATPKRRPGALAEADSAAA